MEYIVSIAIDGRIDIQVEANSFEEAREKALASVGDADFDTLDVVGSKAVNAESETGEFIDY